MTKNPIISFYNFVPREVTLREVIDADDKNVFIDFFRLTTTKERPMTHEEITTSCERLHMVTHNELNRLVNIVKTRPVELAFEDQTFTQHVADLMKAFRFTASKRTAVYRVGVKVSVGEAIREAVKHNEALLDTVIGFKFKMSGSSLLQMRKISSAIVSIHAPFSAFQIEAPDMESRRTFKAARGDTRGAALA